MVAGSWGEMETNMSVRSTMQKWKITNSEARQLCQLMNRVREYYSDGRPGRKIWDHALAELEMFLSARATGTLDALRENKEGFCPRCDERFDNVLQHYRIRHPEVAPQGLGART